MNIIMNLDKATTVIEKNYDYLQYEKITSSLCDDAIITLGKLCKEKNKRNLKNETIDKLSKLENHRQCGYIANPYVQNLIDTCISQILKNYQTSANNFDIKISKESTTLNNPITPDKPKPEPEPDMNYLKMVLLIFLVKMKKIFKKIEYAY